MREAKKRKGIEAQRAKYPVISRGTDVVIEDEEQGGKQKREKKKKNAGSSYPRLFNRLLFF